MRGLIDRLARVRPIFLSEADFQHALAWQIQVENPTASVRLEIRPERRTRLDLLVGVDEERVAIELKYLVARFEGMVGEERFELPTRVCTTSPAMTSSRTSLVSSGSSRTASRTRGGPSRFPMTAVTGDPGPRVSPSTRCSEFTRADSSRARSNGSASRLGHHERT